MTIKMKNRLFAQKREVFLLFSLIIPGLIGIIPYFEFSSAKSNDPIISSETAPEVPGLFISQGNSILPVAYPPELIPDLKKTKEVMVVATAYSSSPEETDESPFTTASGSQVRNGIVAANFLPFGTKIRIPEVYGDKIFIVKDRMHPGAGYNVDIWFPSKAEALNFGAKLTKIEVVQES